MKFLRNILLNNIVIKIASLVLAVLTWAYIASLLYVENADRQKEAPSIIEVSGEKLIAKKLPIYVNIEGRPAAGYRIVLDKIAVNPSHSVVAGPQAIIKDLTYIATEPVNIDGKSNSIRKRISLSSIPNCQIGHDSAVTVTIPIIKKKRR